MRQPTSEQRQAGILLERAAHSAALTRALEETVSSGHGRAVLIGGEAGVGKTSLLRAFCDAQPASARIYWGACDPLFTPRPLGPLFELVEGTGGELEELVSSGGAKPHELAAALLGQLATSKGTLLVLEDLHWADEATLDVLRLLARQVQRSPTLLLGSYRDDQLDRTHPLRVVLGELATSPAVSRLALERLSPEAVAGLAAPHEIDPELLYRQTAGNPFFVTEVLAGGDGEIPPTVRDAVLARTTRLAPEALALLEAVAVVPPQADLWLLEKIAAEQIDRVEECLASGMLTSAQASVAFRHELARIAVEESLTPDRALVLHRAALEALAAPPSGMLDLTRLAHHAEAAGDHAAVLRFAPQAAARAASLGAHREAAAQYERALRFAEGEPPEAKADWLERCSHEYYLSGQVERAVPLGERALAHRREVGDPLREGDSLRSLSHLLSFVGRPAEGEKACREAIALLEQLDPGPELALAYATLAQRCLNWEDIDGALGWGARARDLAERLDEPAILAHALITIGAAEFRAEPEPGLAKLESALALARGAGLDDHTGRAYLNIVTSFVRQRRYADAQPYLDAGLALCAERGLDYWRLCLIASRSRMELAAGRWSDAGESASSVLRDPRDAALGRVMALAVLSLVRARRGDPEASDPLDQGMAFAQATGEPQQIAPLAAARAETAWLEGRPAVAVADTQAALELALGAGSAWEVGELASWGRRLGVPADVAPAAAAGPFELELAARYEQAAALWTELGCPYDAALALADSGEAGALRTALGEFQRLGAQPAAAVVARRLRERGERGLPRGPRHSTRANRANLTPRELEVLALLTEGLRNVDIAERLFVAEKTVDHHVSSILRKLDARTRGEASAKALRLGLTHQDR